MSYMTIDADCTGNGGLDLITIDISNSSSLCRSTSSNIDANTSQSMETFECDDVLVQG